MKKQSQFLTIGILPVLFNIANAADLSTTFSSTYSKITINNTITYTGSVVNKGVDTASNVQLLFYMPPKNVSVSNLPSGCSSANTKIICSIGELNVGDSASRSVSVFYTQKGANFVSVNAITDSNDTNYRNNSTRLTTNVTASTNTENSPLIPNVFSTKVNPTSIVQGNAVTFIANLDAPLPNGYSVKVNYDSNNYALSGSGTNYSLSNTPTTAGLKSFRTGIYDNYGSLKGSEMTGTFEVTKQNTAPTLSLISGADTATAGTAYALQLQANDADGNLSNIQITNWGDGSSDYQNATNNSTLSFSHTFNSAGSYTISAIAYDNASASSTAVSKTITISQPVTVETFTSGSKTFSYTKIANDGSILPKTATLGSGAKDWACTKDNNTGLIWEVKTDDGGLRDTYFMYSWYEPDVNKNGGNAGYTDTWETPYCSKTDNCNTYAYTNAVNAQGLCGKNDWRLPTISELRSLIYCSDGKYNTLAKGEEAMGYVCASDTIYKIQTIQPTINTTYFPHTTNAGSYWSSSLRGYYNDVTVGVFSYGGDAWSKKDNSNYVQLVHDGQ